MTPCATIALFVGSIRPLPESGRPTGIYKQPVHAPLALGPEGLAGDHQADRRVHGGRDKAVHLYPAGHYARLAERFPAAARLLLPGSLGENLSTADLDENDICLGDIWRLGHARLQLSQPRSPCWKIDERFGCDGMAAFIAETGRTGWYWRVLAPGTVSPGDALMLEQRSAEPISLATATASLRHHRPPVAMLDRIAAAPGIAADWRRKIADRADWLRRHPAPAAPRST